MNDISICPVCKKEFKLTDKHMYVFNGKHTCSWRCFLKGYESVNNYYPKLTLDIEEKHRKSREQEKLSQQQLIMSDIPIKRKRGRPKKNI